MRKIKVTGPSIKEIMEKFKKSITSPLGESAKIELYREKDDTTFEMIIDVVDARIWHFPESAFNDDEELKKVLILKGWINKEYNKKLNSTVGKDCTLEIFVTEENLLKIK